jgi:hypothetical protein
MEVAAARASVLEAELALQTFNRKLEIRQRLLKKEIESGEAELRVLEAETDQRLKALAPKIEVARKEVQDLQMRVEVGTAAPRPRSGQAPASGTADRPGEGRARSRPDS